MGLYILALLPQTNNVCCYDSRLHKGGLSFFDKYAKLYFGFVFFYLVACFSTGGFDIALRNLLSYYLVAFVGYQSTRMIISKYRGARFVLLSLLSIFLLMLSLL